MLHPDEKYAVVIRKAQESVARLNRIAQDQARENAELTRRIDEIETTLAHIRARLDALEALADVVIDTPIPFEPAQFAEAA